MKKHLIAVMAAAAALAGCQTSAGGATQPVIMYEGRSYTHKPVVRVEWRENLFSQYGWRNKCAGTLAADSKVLTAAHCVFDKIMNPKFPENYEVVTTDGRRIKVKSIFVAPDYTLGKEGKTSNHGPDQIINDWAVVSLDEPLGLSEGVFPVRSLRDGNLPGLGDGPFAAVGYSKDDRLKNVHSGCMPLERYNEVILVDCDAWHGDSGGPLLAYSGGAFFAVGVASALYKDPKAAGYTLLPQAALDAITSGGTGGAAE